MSAGCALFVYEPNRFMDTSGGHGWRNPAQTTHSLYGLIDKLGVDTSKQQLHSQLKLLPKSRRVAGGKKGWHIGVLARGGVS